MEKEKFFIIYYSETESSWKTGILHEKYEDAFKDYEAAMSSYADCKICKTIYG